MSQTLPTRRKVKPMKKFKPPKQSPVELRQIEQKRLDEVRNVAQLRFDLVPLKKKKTQKGI
jgi:hypothetical protein